MEMILLNVNNPSASIITFFRLIPENSKGVMGADIATSFAKLLQKSEMRKDIVIELSYKGFG